MIADIDATICYDGGAHPIAADLIGPQNFIRGNDAILIRISLWQYENVSFDINKHFAIGESRRTQDAPGLGKSFPCVAAKGPNELALVGVKTGQRSVGAAEKEFAVMDGGRRINVIGGIERPDQIPIAFVIIRHAVIQSIEVSVYIESVEAVLAIAANPIAAVGDEHSIAVNHRRGERDVIEIEVPEDRAVGLVEAVESAAAGLIARGGKHFAPIQSRR